VVPVIFSRKTFSHPAAFSWRTCLVSILGGRPDARIAVNHTAIVHQKSASEKASSLRALGVMQIFLNYETRAAGAMSPNSV